MRQISWMAVLSLMMASPGMAGSLYTLTIRYHDGTVSTYRYLTQNACNDLAARNLSSGITGPGQVDSADCAPQS